MGLFGIGSHSGSREPANPVKLVQDASGTPAVSGSKLDQHVSLKKKADAVGVSLKKKSLAGIRAQVVVVLDHSGSMYSDYQNHKVQNLVERFLAFGLSVDIDGEVPVIPFDSRVKPTVNVTIDNYSGVVGDQIFKPNDMGSTNLAAALREVRELAKKTDAPLFVAVITDGEPNSTTEATEIVCDLARYPVFIKFLAVREVRYLQELDDLGDDKRLLDNVDSKFYDNVTSVSDEQFADDMVDEWDSWTTAALKAGVLLGGGSDAT